MTFANDTTNATFPLMSISYCRDGETRYAIDSPPLYELIYVIVALIVSVVTSLGVQRSRLRRLRRHDPTTSTPIYDARSGTDRMQENEIHV